VGAIVEDIEEAGEEEAQTPMPLFKNQKLGGILIMEGPIFVR